MSWAAGDMNLPFEASPPGQFQDNDASVAGGMVVVAAVIPVPGAGPMATLVFRFTNPDGSFMPAVALVLDDEEAFAAAQLVGDAATAAVKAARRERAA